MRRFVIAFIAVLVLAPAAYAEDFTFNVPVRVENMTSSGGGLVRCYVFRDEASSFIGEGEANITFTDGRYTGTVPVRVRMRLGERRDAVRRYDCLLGVQATAVDGRSRVVLSRWPADYSEYTRITGQELVSQQTIVSGAIP